MVQGCAQIIDICSCICIIDTTSLGITELFRCRIASRTKCGCICIVLYLVLFCCTEVDQLYAALRLDHDIRRFHIPVDNRWIHVVQVIQCTCKLQAPLYHQLLWLCAFLLQSILNRITLDIIHNNVDRSILIDDIYDSRQHRMIYVLQNIRFSFQSLKQRLCGFLSIILDLLDRPLLVQTLITGKVHDGHTTSTNFCQNFIFSV